MKLVITPDQASACAHVADMLYTCCAHNPAAVLGLATGRTMEQVYGRLVRRIHDAPVNLANCTTFNLDEYCGFVARTAHSYRAYMQHHLFRHLDIPPTQTHLPPGDTDDATAACARYETAIRAAGGIDLQLLGIGHTGHIGFNEPLSSFASRTRRVRLAPATRAQNAEMFGGCPDNVPHHALTVGVGTILETRRAVLLATGPGKAAIIARVIEGAISPMTSASALHFHPDCTFVLDEDAAMDLSDECRWMAEYVPSLTY
ncbi:glucosamine-6-phosphate deaminase [Komagataeibacter diospyri]|uniref:Glucosamine-6-phosphate deaminase n=1 Tax=Komagataeibacter diospyri TaxID=1932662 RepID=A0A4P5NQJ0_9PROT|nr:glucosamine-6-phosphate deaminase [Komagataeibacter diospyri]GCE82374.1 glucosamine-6-phosphate deaminase [Komagataeibacter diospyri]